MEECRWKKADLKILLNCFEFIQFCSKRWVCAKVEPIQDPCPPDKLIKAIKPGDVDVKKSRRMKLKMTSWLRISFALDVGIKLLRAAEPSHSGVDSPSCAIGIVSTY